MMLNIFIGIKIFGISHIIAVSKTEPETLKFELLRSMNLSGDKQLDQIKYRVLLLKGIDLINDSLGMNPFKKQARSHVETFPQFPILLQ